MASTTVAITREQRRQFADEGYFILERALSEEELAVLRGALDDFVVDIEAEMDAAGTDVLGLSHRGQRYFIANRHRENEAMRRLLLSDLFAGICRATLGDEAYLFWEQYVVKVAEVGMDFAWHQDSGYLQNRIPDYSRPYLTCWCALDDMSEANGTVYLLPYSRAGTKDVQAHRRDGATNDMVVYEGEDPGIPAVVPEGSIVVFSSTLFHRSGANTTGTPRRSYVAQYSADPLLMPDGTPIGFADPILAGGVRVSD